MTVDGIDILTYSELILEALASVPEVEELTDSEAADLARGVGIQPNYDPNADLATITDDELQERKQMIGAQQSSLASRNSEFKSRAEFYEKLKASVPETIGAMQKHLKKLQAHYDLLIANEWKKDKALADYKAEIDGRMVAVEAEMQGRRPVTFAEMQAMLKQAREGKA